MGFSIGHVRTTIDEVRSKRVTFLAASIAYYAFVSLIPLVVLALVAAGAVGGRDLALQVASVVGGTLSVSQQGLVTTILENGTTAGGVTIVGLLTLVWSSMKIFRGLDVAFSRAYGVAGPDSFVDQLTDAAVTLGAVVLAAIATVVVGALVALVQADALLAGVTDLSAGIVGTLSLILALTIALLPLYYFLPAENVTLREAIPGAVFAAVGWTALQTAFRYYTQYAGSYEQYGAIGGALLLVTFLYFAGIVLLVGAVVNAVLAGRYAGSDRATPGPQRGSATDGSD